MTTAYIYDHLRTPRGRGKPDGSLHEVPSNTLAAGLLSDLRDRHTLDTSLVDDVILGCVDPVYEAGGDIARTAILESGYDESVPGVQLSRYCASGLDAVNFAAAKIESGSDDITIGGGVESMSRIGLGAAGNSWPTDPGVAIPSYFVPQGISADLIATKYGFSRDDVDAYAVESQRRAKESWQKDYFKNSISSVKDINGITLLSHDEHMRDTDMQSLASLNPSFSMMGEMAGFDAVSIQKYPELESIDHVHHAGNSSGIVDGAALVLLGSESGGKSLGLQSESEGSFLHQHWLGACNDADRSS